MSPEAGTHHAICPRKDVLTRSRLLHPRPAVGLAMAAAASHCSQLAPHAVAHHIRVPEYGVERVCRGVAARDMCACCPGTSPSGCSWTAAALSGPPLL